MLKRKGFKVLLCCVLSMVMVTSVVGCGKSAKQSATAKDTLVFAQGADPRGLDPAMVDDGESAKPMANIYETLVKYNENSTAVEPGLATDWQMAPDGLSWTFHLRKGVKFQDGTDFNADAVKFTVDRQLPPQVTADMPYASFTFGPVKEVQVIDPYTVKFVLNAPYAPFLANLAMALAAPIVSPTAVKKYGSDFNNHPVGTGPYKFVKWDKGQQVVLAANTSYWGPQPKIKNVIFKIVPENSVRTSELLTGEADIIDGVDPNDVAKLESNGMKVAKDAGMNINYMGFMCDVAPFDNPKVRQAISYAINTNDLIKYLYKGLAKPAPSMLPDFIPGYDPTLTGYKYDPEKAKSLLKEAGFANGLSVKMITYSNPRPYNPVGGEKLAAAIQAQLSKVGVTATIQSYPWKEYKDALFKADKNGFQMFFYGWTGDNGDPDNFLNLLGSSQIEQSLNSAKFSNPTVDKMIADGATSMDKTKRVQIYKDLQKVVQDQAPWVFISHGDTLSAYNPNVKNFHYHPTGVVHLWFVQK